MRQAGAAITAQVHSEGIEKRHSKSLQEMIRRLQGAGYSVVGIREHYDFHWLDFCDPDAHGGRVIGSIPITGDEADEYRLMGKTPATPGQRRTIAA